MREELYTKYGMYSPTFFRMHVDTPEDLSNLAGLSEHGAAIYYHEYIHFIQDITTCYGLMNISQVVEYLKYSAASVLSRQEESFETPIVVTLSGQDNVFSNLELKKRYLGSGKADNFKGLKSIQVVSEDLQTNDGIIEVRKVILKCEDNLGREFDYNFGSYCISENMAYAMETMAYANVLSSPSSLPYRAVEYLVEHIYPSLDRSPLNIIALCDASLMYYQPGYVLYAAVIKMRDENFVPAEPRQVMDFIYDNTPLNYYGFTTVNQLLVGTGTEAINNLNGYFTTELFDENRQWINYMISVAIDFRIEAPYFILELARQGPINVNKVFSWFSSTIGAPIAVNANTEMFTAMPQHHSFNIAPQYLWLINQIYQIFQGKLEKGTFKCELIKWCDDSANHFNKPIFTDDRCRYDPWKWAKEIDPHPCSFGKLWKTWALAGRSPSDT